MGSGPRGSRGELTPPPPPPPRGITLAECAKTGMLGPSGWGVEQGLPKPRGWQRRNSAAAEATATAQPWHPPGSRYRIHPLPRVWRDTSRGGALLAPNARAGPRNTLTPHPPPAMHPTLRFDAPRTIPWSLRPPPLPRPRRPARRLSPRPRSGAIGSRPAPACSATTWRWIRRGMFWLGGASAAEEGGGAGSWRERLPCARDYRRAKFGLWTPRRASAWLGAVLSPNRD